MRENAGTNLKVGVFVTFGVGLIMLAILVLGGQTGFLNKLRFRSHFTTIDGLIPGAKVAIGGLTVGAVEKIEFDPTTRDIEVTFNVEKKAGEWIRTDATVEIATQGVLGDKFLAVNSGDFAQPQLSPNAIIPNRPGRDFSQFISKGDQLLATLNRISGNIELIIRGMSAEGRSEAFFKNLTSTSKNVEQLTNRLNHEVEAIELKSSIAHLKQILEKVNNGTGTLGALVNDASLYDQIKALLGGANRNRIMRNIIRQTMKDPEEGSSPKSQ